MYVLEYYDQGKQQIVKLNKPKILLGRDDTCDVVLHYPKVSRVHAKIVSEGDKYILYDNQSRNGTLVNGVPVTSKVLEDGDWVTLGSLQLRFKNLRVESADELPPNTISLSVKDFTTKNLFYRAYESESKETLKLVQVDKEQKVLGTVSELAKILITTHEVDRLLERLMDFVFEILPVERGFIVLFDEKSGQLVRRVTRHRQPTQEPVVYSKTIIDKVFREKTALLILDAPEQFPMSRTIAGLPIRSAMCVPLWQEEEVLGVLQLDTSYAKAFSAADLNLMVAMGNLAAVGVYHASLNEKICWEREARSRLERYNSPGVVTHILSSVSPGSSVSLQAEEREISVLFADIVGFTSMSEKMEPQRVAVLLNECFHNLTEIVFKYAGTLDKYIGDAIMAVFGAPLLQTDHALRAVRTALEIMKSLEEINQHRTPETRVRMRIAINTGKVVAGDIGSPKRMEYTVLGNTVNVASRLESQVAKADEIIIGEATYSAIQECIEAEPLASILLKGLERPMRPYRVTGLRKDI